jgi:PhnB protein
MHVPPGFAPVIPYIFAADAEAYIRFLSGGLGGVESGRSTRPDGTIANCHVRFGSTTLMVSEAQAEYPAGRAAFYFYVPDADAAVARAIAAGATLEMAVADMPYGDRQGGVVDPAGNIWWISQRLTDAPYY